MRFKEKRRTQSKSNSTNFLLGLIDTKQFSAMNSISAAEKNGPVPLKQSATGIGDIPLQFGFTPLIEGVDWELKGGGEL